MTSHRTTGALLISAVVAAVLAGCSSPSAATSAAPAAQTKDQAQACSAAVAVDSTIPPGVDPDSPAPAPAQMQAWAASVEPQFRVLLANAPDSLAPVLQTYSAQLDQAKAGQRIDVSSPENAASAAGLDGWVYSSCGYQTLDVTNDGGTLSHLPATLKAGPVAIRFRNTGDPAKAGFVLLTAKVRDGQTITPAQVDSGAVNLEASADIIAGAQPAGPNAAYSVAVLQPGSYLVSAVLGTPPDFAGTTSGAFTVS